MVDGIKDMLDRGISFSLYMTHGGTTFGWWGGANNPAYSAMCSSYDYDAPISEAGWTTPKYFLLRDLLKQYIPEGETLPEPPAPYPVIEIPAVTEWQVAPLFDNLPEPKHSDDIRPMEMFDQGWGCILYRTTLQDDASGELHLDEMHDWAQVFADGKLLGRLDRRKGEFTLPLKETLKKGTRLDILVEAMGRVNFDKSIHDRKGITKKVEIIRDGQATELKGWTVYSLTPFYDFVSDRDFRPGKAVDGPAWYRATFTLDHTGDTFLDMQTWGKGMVWVNGHAMGRFWEIGPQQTLYMPGCWLREGENEIIVLDLKGPAETKVPGLKRPILDMLRVKAPETHRKDGQNLKLTGETPVHSGTFAQGNGWQEVKFKAPAEGRYLCLDATSNYDGTNIAAIAELDVLDENGRPLPREDWKVVYADSEETRSGNRTADKVYDRQESTFWQTVDNTAFPHQLIIDLGGQHKVTGLRMLPRAEAGAPGLIKDYKVYVKASDFTY